MLSIQEYSKKNARLWRGFGVGPAIVDSIRLSTGRRSVRVGHAGRSGDSFFHPLGPLSSTSTCDGQVTETFSSPFGSDFESETTWHYFGVLCTSWPWVQCTYASIGIWRTILAYDAPLGLACSMVSFILCSRQ